MGQRRGSGTGRSTSPTADHLLRRAEIERAIRDLAVPHRKKDAYWRLREFGAEAREAVEAGLLADDPGLRAQCALLIDRLASNESFELMLLLLDDPDAKVRLHALHALACDRCKTEDVCALPRTQVIPEAARMLETDPDPHVRAIALEVLARWVHEDQDARTAIERAAEKDPAPGNRKKAKWYLPGGKPFERTKPKARARVGSRSRTTGVRAP